MVFHTGLFGSAIRINRLSDLCWQMQMVCTEDSILLSPLVKEDEPVANPLMRMRIHLGFGEDFISVCTVVIPEW